MIHDVLDSRFFGGNEKDSPAIAWALTQVLKLLIQFSLIESLCLQIAPLQNHDGLKFYHTNRQQTETETIFENHAKFFNTMTLSIVRVLPDESAAGAGDRGCSPASPALLPATLCPAPRPAAALRAV